MSSDGSDDENVTRLREAVDPEFIDDSMFIEQSSGKIQTPQCVVSQSVRSSRNDDEQFNLFRVTPQFRNYVAKHLSNMLDSLLKYKTNGTNNCGHNARRKGGVKLFKTSSHYLKLNSLTDSIYKPKPKLIITTKNNMEKCKLVAINADDICKETQHWSNRSKLPVYTYIKTNQGLVLQ